VFLLQLRWDMLWDDVMEVQTTFTKSAAGAVPLQARQLLLQALCSMRLDRRQRLISPDKICMQPFVLQMHSRQYALARGPH
jgi:hypothetical protein